MRNGYAACDREGASVALAGQQRMIVGEPWVEAAAEDPDGQKSNPDELPSAARCSSTFARGNHYTRLGALVNYR